MHEVLLILPRLIGRKRDLRRCYFFPIVREIEKSFESTTERCRTRFNRLRHTKYEGASFQLQSTLREKMENFRSDKDVPHSKRGKNNHKLNAKKTNNERALFAGKN